MSAPVARFEGLDPARIDDDVAEMRPRLDGVRSGVLPPGATQQALTVAKTEKRV